MKFDLVIFDLDGTLIDSLGDIVVAVNDALQSVGRIPLTAERVRGYVGRGARVLMQRCVGGISDEVLDRAYREFIVQYEKKLLVHTRLFNGVASGLDRMKGIVKAVMTNKQEGMSRQILAGLGVAHHFVSVIGGDSLPTKKPSPEGVRKLLEEYRVPQNRCLMVGDSSVDMETARAAGVLSCGVSYGYRQDDHELDGANFIVDRFDQVADLAG